MRDLRLTICIVLLGLAGCDSAPQADTEKPEAAAEPPYEMASGASEFDLTEAEQKSFRTAALSGDPIAAKRLARYYSFIEFDTVQSVRWLRIAVGDGDPITAQNLAYDLRTLGGVENCKESLSILREIRDGYPDPEFIDESIRDLESDFKQCVSYGRWPPNNSFKPKPLRGSA